MTNSSQPGGVTCNNLTVTYRGIRSGLSGYSPAPAGSSSDELLTVRDNTGFSDGLHCALIQYITKIMNSCFSYILHLFSVWLANLLANSFSNSIYQTRGIYL